MKKTSFDSFVGLRNKPFGFNNIIIKLFHILEKVAIKSLKIKYSLREKLRKIFPL